MKKPIVAFCCENSALKAAAGLQDASVLRAVELVRLPCTGKVEIGLLLECLERGHPGVLVLGCPVDNCKYLSGSSRASKRVAMARKLLRETGLDEERLRMDFISSVDSFKFERIVREMQARLAGGKPSEAVGTGARQTGAAAGGAGPGAGLRTKGPAGAAAKGGGQ